MDIESYSRGLDEVHELAEQRRFREALTVVEGLLQDFPFSPHLLVRRGCLIQLLEDDEHPGLPLEVAGESFETARRLAPDYVEPRIELGYYLYAVQDRNEEALEQFKAARKVAETQLQE